MSDSVNDQGRDDFESSWRRWHEDRERQFGDPYGWLSVVDRVFVTETPVHAAHAPGAWALEGDRVRVSLAPEERLTLDGEALDGSVLLPELGDREELFLEGPDVRVELSRWNQQYLLRPRWAKAPALSRFRGIPAFEPDPAWVIEARIVPWVRSRRFRLPTEGGLEEVYESPGAVEFEHGGEQHRLVAFNAHTAIGTSGLWFLFRDGTSGVETYGASRRLQTERVRDDGTVTLDFTRAANLPCAFSDFTVCPLPPAENTLPFRVTAGEQTPYERAASAADAAQGS